MVTPEISRMAEDIGYIRAKIEDMAGPQGRITQLENHQARNFWVTVAVVPLMTIAHAFARKFGVDV